MAHARLECSNNIDFFLSECSIVLLFAGRIQLFIIASSEVGKLRIIEKCVIRLFIRDYSGIIREHCYKIIS